ncbi:hypothetical protein ACLS0R_10000 [Comamonas jiangduensis]|jgi:hypothetical protein|uniref:hypothetical protein n=1 Tax=Comamonas jiangduensis TaxID=1194168 RepID=UPI003BF805F0
MITKKKRAPSLSNDDLIKIVEIIDSWKGRLTWELLLDEIEIVVGSRYSRYTFYDYPEIQNAFGFKKNLTKKSETAKGQSKSREPSTPKDPRVAAALEQISRGLQKIKRLEHENSLLIEQFVRWAHNAQRKGLSIEDLNQPLSRVERDRSNLK